MTMLRKNDGYFSCKNQALCLAIMVKCHHRSSVEPFVGRGSQANDPQSTGDRERETHRKILVIP